MSGGTGQVGKGQDRSSQVGSGQVRTFYWTQIFPTQYDYLSAQVEYGQVKSAKVKSGQGRTCQVRTVEVRKFYETQIFTTQHVFWHKLFFTQKFSDLNFDFFYYKMQLRMKFDSDVGPTCLSFIDAN